MKKYVIIGNAQSVHLVKWIKELVKFFNVYVISSTTTHKDIRSIIPPENIFDLKMVVKEGGGNVGILKKYFKVVHILKKINPDFVNPHYVTSHGFLISLIKKSSGIKFKLIQSAWGTDILVTPFKNKLYHKITKFCLDTADLATSDSEYMTRVISEISDVKTSTFIFGIEELPNVDISEKDENLFYSNRILSENYNIDEIIRFFKKVVDGNADARLIISNDGPKRSELINLTKELRLDDKISFKGFITLDEQVLFYRKAQFYISIPTSDSTSVSLIEAMAYGCIPVVSDIPANREWIAEGKNGLFYKSGKGVAELNKLLPFKGKILETNRKIVAERAIFPKSIAEYVETINSL